MKHGLNRIFARLRVANGGLMYAAIAKNGEPINGIKAGNRVVVFVRSVSRIKGGRRAKTLVVRTDRFRNVSSRTIGFYRKKGKKKRKRERKKGRSKEEKKERRDRGRKYHDEIEQRVKQDMHDATFGLPRKRMSSSVVKNAAATLSARPI